MGMSEAKIDSTSRFRRALVSESNIDRISETFCKMRGASLKLGQILSTMEDKVVPPFIKKSLERARQEADIMPKE